MKPALNSGGRKVSKTGMPELVTNDIRALAGKDRSEAWN